MATDQGKQDGFRIVGEKALLTPFQRRLFHLLLWHALASDIDEPQHKIALTTLHESLDTAGRTSEWILLNLEKVAATRVRWHRNTGDGAIAASGFTPLLSACWVSDGALTFSFPKSLKPFLRERHLRRLLDLRVEDLLRNPFSAGIHRMLLDFSDAGTTGWMPLTRFCKAAGIETDMAVADGSVLRDKMLMPAAAEISLFSEIAVSVSVRREVGTGTPEIKFLVRRKDDTRSDACLLLPGAGEGEITSELALEQRFEAYKAGLVCDSASALSEAEMTDIQRCFVDSIRGNAVMMKKYEKDGFDSLAVKLAFEVYLEKLFLSDRQRDPEWYQRKAEGNSAED